VLNANEAERVLRMPNRRSALGLRDRAVLEVLYSSGLRRAELTQLRIGDVDAERRVVFVHLGKGQRDRVVPIGRRALRWVQRYLRRARPLLLRGSDCGALFVTSRGGRLPLNRLSERVHRYIEAAGIGKAGSCHLFRHTMATLLLEGGADVRGVQEMLGHANLSTTARYTHVSIARLQAVHARAHPAERKEGRLGQGRRQGPELGENRR
jgi:integrase/recombinase XerD